MIISYFNKEKIIKSQYNAKFKKSAKNGTQEPTRFYETKEYPCNLFQQDKNKLWKNAIDFYCFSESMRRFKHDLRQPLTIIGLVADDLQQCFEHNELDAQTLTQNVQTLHNQVKRLDTMLVEFVAKNMRDDAAILLNVATIVQQFQSSFEDTLCITIDTETSVWGQENMVLCLFYAFFEMLQSYQANIDNDSPLHICIAQSGANFECDFTNLKNHIGTFQTILTACNNALKRQKIDFYFGLSPTKTGGVLGFFHQNTP